MPVANRNSPRSTQKAPPAGLPVPTAELPSAQRSCRPTTNRRMETAGDAAAASKNHVGLAAPSQARTVQLKEAPRMRKGFFFPFGALSGRSKAVVVVPFKSGLDAPVPCPAERIPAVPHWPASLPFGDFTVRSVSPVRFAVLPALRQGMSMTCIGKKGSSWLCHTYSHSHRPSFTESILCGNSEAVRRPKNSISIVWWITSAPQRVRQAMGPTATVVPAT